MGSDKYKKRSNVETYWKHMVNKDRVEDDISRIFNDADAVTSAIQAGINGALWRHKLLGSPICIWRDG